MHSGDDQNRPGYLIEQRAATVYRDSCGLLCLKCANKVITYERREGCRSDVCRRGQSAYSVMSR